MKNLNIVNVMDDKQYYSDKEYLTNTMIGWIIISAAYFKKQVSLMGLERDDEKHFHFGSAVHCKLLEKKEFAKRFFVQTSKAPSNIVQKKFCSLLISNKKIDDKSLISAYKLSYSVAKQTNESILKSAKPLYEKYIDYIKQEKKGANKIALTVNEYERILSIERNVLNNKRAVELLKQYKNVESGNEAVFKYKINNYKFKSKLDRYIIDTIKKKIIVVDVKTHSTMKEDVNFTKSFKKAFDKYNYDRQLYVYMIALIDYFCNNYPEENFDDYDIEYKIIAIRSNFDNCVKVYNVDHDYILRGEEKLNKALELYKFYETEGYDKDFYTDNLGEELLTID